MANLKDLFERSSTSGLTRWWFNRILQWMIPFNRPHGIVVVETGEWHIRTRLPYRRNNFNHIKGLHACGLATLSEFTTGLLLITKLDPGRYRLILQRLEMDYLYQGRMDAYATFSMTPAYFEQEVLQALTQNEKITLTCTVTIEDEQKHHLTTGKVIWQIKDWSKVKTK
ncbi:MAG: DUF4442 domain-containing protein [Cyclobacteriaceae bacterium]|nr:DUF4442 domain-containing protein [Cyclobacteriaceae bacterium]